MDASEALAAMRLDDTIAKAAASTVTELAAARRSHASALNASRTAAAAVAQAAGPVPLPEEALYHRSVARRITAPAGKRVSVAFADGADTSRRAAVDRAAALVELGQDLEAISARMREDADAVRALGRDNDSYGDIARPPTTTTTAVGAALIGDFGSPVRRKPTDARPDPAATAAAATRIAAAVNKERRSPRRSRPGAETFDAGPSSSGYGYGDGHEDAGFGATALDVMLARDGLSAGSTATFPSLLRGGAAAGGARSPRAVSPSRSEREAATEDYVRQHTVGGAPRLNMRAGRAAASAQVFPSTATMVKPAALGTGGLHARRPDVVASLAAKRENAGAAVVPALLSRTSTSALALPPAGSLGATAAILGGRAGAARHAAEAATAVDATLSGAYDEDDDDGAGVDAFGGKYDGDESGAADASDYGPDGSAAGAGGRGGRAKRRGAAAAAAAAGGTAALKRSAFPARKEPLQSQRAAAAVAPAETPGIRSGARLLPSPAELVFKDFTVGQPAVLQLRITNVALAFNAFQILELADVVRDLFSVDHVPPGKMSPGTDVLITVTFLPRRNVDIDTDLTLRSPSGVLRVPLRCRVKRAAPELSLQDWREQSVVAGASLPTADAPSTGAADALAAAASAVPIRCDFGPDMHPGATRAQVLRLRNRGALPLSVTLVRGLQAKGSSFAFKDAAAVATAQADALTTPIGDAPPGSVPATTAAIGLVPEAPASFVVDSYSSRSFAVISCAAAPGPAVAEWELHCEELGGVPADADAGAGLAATSGAAKRAGSSVGAGSTARRQLGIYSLSLSVGVRDVPIYLPQPLLRFGAISSGREYTACLLVRNRAPQTYRVTAAVGRVSLAPLPAAELAQQPGARSGTAAAEGMSSGSDAGGSVFSFAAIPLGEALLDAAASNRLAAAASAARDGAAADDRGVISAVGAFNVEQQLSGVVVVEPASSYVPPADTGAAAPATSLDSTLGGAMSPGGRSRGATGSAAAGVSMSGTTAPAAGAGPGVDASLVSDGACGLTIRLSVSREWMARQRAAWAAHQIASSGGDTGGSSAAATAAAIAASTSTWRMRIPCSLSASGGSAASLSSFRLPFAVEADISDPLLTLDVIDDDKAGVSAAAASAGETAPAPLSIGNVPDGSCVRHLLRVTSHSDLPTSYSISTSATLVLGDGALSSTGGGTAAKVAAPAGALTVVEATQPAAPAPGAAPTCGDATVAAMLPLRFLHLAPRETRLLALLFAPTRVGGYAGRLRLTSVEPGVPAEEAKLEAAAERDVSATADASASAAQLAAQLRLPSTEIVLPWAARATPRLIFASLSRLLLPPLTGDETAVATIILRHASGASDQSPGSDTNDVAVAWRAESSLPKVCGLALTVAPLDGVIAPGGEARLTVSVAAAATPAAAPAGSGNAADLEAAVSEAVSADAASVLQALDGTTGLRIFACAKPPAAAALSALVSARASITEGAGDFPVVPKHGLEAATGAGAGHSAVPPPHQVLTIPLLTAPPRAREPLFSVAPARQLSVGGVDVGGSRSSSISVTNRTSLPLRVRLRIADPGAGAAFTLPIPLALLRPRESLAVPLLFSPADGRRYACTVLVTGRPSDAATVTEAAAGIGGSGGGSGGADGGSDAVGSRTRVTPVAASSGVDAEGGPGDLAVQQSLQVTGFGLLPSLSFMSMTDAATAAAAATGSAAPDAAAALAPLQPALKALAEGVQVLSLEGPSSTASGIAAAASDVIVASAAATGFATSALRVDFGVMMIGDDAARVVIIANDAPFPVPFAVARLPDSALAIAEAGRPATPAAAAALPLPRLSPACGDPSSPWFLSDAVPALHDGDAPSSVANAAAAAGSSAAAGAARGSVFALEPSEGVLAAGERRALRVGLATSSAAASARLLGAAAGCAIALRTSAAFAVVVGGGAAAGTAGRTALTAAAASGAGGATVRAPAVKPLLVTMTALLSDRRVAVLPPEPRLLVAYSSAAPGEHGAAAAALAAPRLTQLRLPGGAATQATGAGTASSALPAAGLLREASFAGSSATGTAAEASETALASARVGSASSSASASASASAAALPGANVSAHASAAEAGGSSMNSLRVCLPPLLLDAPLQRPPAAAIAAAALACAPASASAAGSGASANASSGAGGAEGLTETAGAPSQLAIACCDRAAAAASLPLSAALLRGPASTALVSALPLAPFLAAAAPAAAQPASAPASAASGKPAPAAGKGAAPAKGGPGATTAPSGAAAEVAAAIAAASTASTVADESWSQPAPVALFMLPPSAPVEDDAALLEALLAPAAQSSGAASLDATAAAAAAAPAAAKGKAAPAAPASAGAALGAAAAAARSADPLAGTVLGAALAAVGAAASDEAASAAAGAVAPLLMGARAETAWLSCSSGPLQLPTAGAGGADAAAAAAAAGGKDKAAAPAAAAAAKGGKGAAPAAGAAPGAAAASAAGSNCGVLRESLAPGAARCLRFAVPAAAVAPQAISPLAEAHLPWLPAAGIIGAVAAGGLGGPLSGSLSLSGLALGAHGAASQPAGGRVVTAESARHCYGLLVLPPSAAASSSTTGAAAAAAATAAAPKIVRIRFSVAPEVAHA